VAVQHYRDSSRALASPTSVGSARAAQNDSSESMPVFVVSSLRFGIGRFNTQAEIDYVAARVVETVKRLRELSPMYEAQSGH